MTARRLRAAALVCHAGLAASVAAATLTLPFAPGVRGLTLAAALVPLLIAGYGLALARRKAYVSGALLLVVYVGIAATEVVASATRASFATLALFLALVELALLLALTRT